MRIIRFVALLAFLPSLALAQNCYLGIGINDGPPRAQRPAIALYNPPGSGVNLRLSQVDLTYLECCGTYTTATFGADLRVPSEPLPNMGEPPLNADGRSNTPAKGQIRWGYYLPTATGLPDRARREFFIPKMKTEPFTFRNELIIPPGSSRAIIGWKPDVDADPLVWLNTSWQWCEEPL